MQAPQTPPPANDDSILELPLSPERFGSGPTVLPRLAAENVVAPSEESSTLGTNTATSLIHNTSTLPTSALSTSSNTPLANSTIMFSGESLTSQLLTETVVTTVTTTVRRTSELPTLVFKTPATSLNTLKDRKRFPLGNVPTPPALRKFSLEVENPPGSSFDAAKSFVEFCEQASTSQVLSSPEQASADEDVHPSKKRRATQSPKLVATQQPFPLNHHQSQPLQQQFSHTAYNTGVNSSPTGRPTAKKRQIVNPASSFLISEGALSPQLPLTPGVMNKLTPAASVLSNTYKSIFDPNTLALLTQQYEQAPSQLQAYILFQLAKRTQRPVLQFLTSMTLQAISCDFISELPSELSIHIIKYLDVQSLGRAACVSKEWRRRVDADPQVWKDRLIADGYSLPEELETTPAPEWERPEYWGFKKMDNAHNQATPSETTPKNTTTNSNDFEEFGDEEDTPVYRTRSSVRRSRRTATSRRTQVISSTSTTAAASVTSPVLSSLPPDEEDHLDPRIEDSPPLGPLPNQDKHPYKRRYWRALTLDNAWKRADCKRLSFAGHDRNVVTCLHFSGRRIISGSDDHTIAIWDAETGQLVRTLQGHEGGVWALAVIGDTIVSGSTDRSTRVWDAETGRCSHIFWGHTSTVRCCKIILPRKHSEKDELVPPYPVIITGSRDHTLRVWRLPSPKNCPASGQQQGSNDTEQWSLHVWQGHMGSVRAVDGWGRWVVSGSYDNNVIIWDLYTGQRKHVLLGHIQKVYSVSMEEGGRRCASGSMDGTVRVWNISDGSCLFALEGHTSLVGLLSLTPHHIISAAADTTLRIWHPTSGELLSVLHGHTGAITCFQASHGRVVSGSDGCLKLWSLTPAPKRPAEFLRPGALWGSHSRDVWIQDLLEGLTGVWQVRFDRRRCVAAVQRNNATWFEVLDFEQGSRRVTYGAPLPRRRQVRVTASNNPVLAGRGGGEGSDMDIE